MSLSRWPLQMQMYMAPRMGALRTIVNCVLPGARAASAFQTGSAPSAGWLKGSTLSGGRWRTGLAPGGGRVRPGRVASRGGEVLERGCDAAGPVRDAGELEAHL